MSSHNWEEVPKGMWTGWNRCVECNAMQPPEGEGDERDAWSDENLEDTCEFRRVKNVQES